ncbi:PD-(D/E)XK motif protein [Acinetobacter pseudolwoffii]|uniref:PD-(D/E)XK motif protein n=1 Tax=Acinetobacter pseudolwoffii TaxID=2053287 RepID=UPI002578F8FB|nr:PD-(D/E)XK motif protein [Acinetobacter pseudolwoffii]MDM1345269.1 PD-(D/E)XK motif protein [Acinetobacter pseudolwoffii]
MHDELLRRWNLLTSSVEQPVFQLFDNTHPLKFYIGKTVENNLFLMLRMSCSPPQVKSMRAIKIKYYHLQEDSTWSLILTLENRNLEPMFSLLCADLITFSKKEYSTEDKAINDVLRRLSYWRLLLEREAFNILSENEVRGLFGELLFLKKIIDHLGLKSALKSWVGPLDAPQDFQTDDCSWEIKTIRPSARSIPISSEYQLHVCKSPIYLVVIELIEVKKTDEIESFSINSLVENIRSLLWEDVEALDLFEAKLSHTGYSPRSEYDDFKFRTADILTYEVAERFPCISNTNLADGLCKVRYEIEISALKKYLINSI